MRSALLALLVLASPLARAATFTLDPAHTTAEFKVRHLMISWVKGQFGRLSGTVEYDPRHLDRTRIDATIEVGSVDTRNRMRDDDLRSPKFFDAARFPSMRFVSTKVAAAGKGRLNVEGELTLRGTTRKVVLAVDDLTGPVQDPWGHERLGATATTTLDRRDFGLTWNQALEAGGVLVGDEVQISLDVEAIRAPAESAAAPAR